MVPADRAGAIARGEEVVETNPASAAAARE
jgi:hypothetical protein